MTFISDIFCYTTARIGNSENWRRDAAAVWMDRREGWNSYVDECKLSHILTDKSFSEHKIYELMIVIHFLGVKRCMKPCQLAQRLYVVKDWGAKKMHLKNIHFTVYKSEQHNLYLLCTSSFDDLPFLRQLT